MRKKFTVIGAVLIILVAGLYILKPYLVDKALLYQAEALGDRFRYDLLKDGKIHVITVGTGLVAWMLSRLDPVAIIERR